MKIADKNILPYHSISIKRCLMLVFMLINIVVFGQTYPTQEPNNATYGSYVAPNGFPDYLEWFETEKLKL